MLEDGLVEGHGKDVDVRRNVDQLTITGLRVVVQGRLPGGGALFNVVTGV